VSQPVLDPFAPPNAELEPRALPGGELPLADLGARFGARIIDGLVLLPFFAAYHLAIKADLMARPSPAWQQLVTQLFLLPMLIYQWRLMATTGQTIGKRALKIRIVRRDGGPVGFVHGVLLREWVTLGLNFVLNSLGPFHVSLHVSPVLKALLSSPALLFELTDPLLIFGPARRTLHDRIADTKVIALPREAAR
jgi:uncharacterized RDD family membrane protein YckC